MIDIPTINCLGTFGPSPPNFTSSRTTRTPSNGPSESFGASYLRVHALRVLSSLHVPPSHRPRHLDLHHRVRRRRRLHLRPSQVPVSGGVLGNPGKRTIMAKGLTDSDWATLAPVPVTPERRVRGKPTGGVWFELPAMCPVSAWRQLSTASTEFEYTAREVRFLSTSVPLVLFCQRVQWEWGAEEWSGEGRTCLSSRASRSRSRRRSGAGRASAGLGSALDPSRTWEDAKTNT